MTNENKYNYRIDFRPLDTFFFGGEVTFGNGEEVNYFAKSRSYPQQTTILGVLRYLGYFTKEIGETDIGESFAAEEYENQGKYGYIESISPLFFTHKGKSAGHQLLGPMLAGAQSAGAPSKAKGEVQRFVGESWGNLYELPDFDPKEWYDQPLMPKLGKADKLGDLVKEDVRIGITKQRDGAERTDGFYKQQVGTLAPDVFFSAYVKLAKYASKITPNQVLPIGAEKSLFRVELSPLPNSETKFSDTFPTTLYQDCKSAALHCAVLLCDAFVESGELEKLPFVVADTQDFRYLTTPARVTDFGRLSRSDGDTKKYPNQIRQSRKYNLLSRGSLLYADDPTVLTKMLDAPRWQTIGYNHYHLLPKSS